MAGGGKHTWRSTGAPPKPTGVGRPGTGGPGSGDDDDPCDIHFETALNSVDETEVKKVARGTRLKVELVEENKLPRLLATLDGARVGVISHPKTLELIGCIKQGNEYVAVVMERQGNLCRVRVERQSP
jgi:hypothetical protein